jgi:tetratricopeptide (TPR) repeat protein
MMLEFGACPQCKLDISPERKAIKPLVCEHCGFTSGNDEIVKNEIEKKNIYAFIGLSVFVVAAYIQLMNWDKHTLNIIPIAVKETIGAAGPSDYEAKAQICMDLKKWDCVEYSYIQTAKADPTLWKRAGDFQMKRAKYAEAARSYYPLFQSGTPQDIEVSYSYAKALAAIGQVDEAVSYFDAILAARPDTLQVTVVQNYVKLLMEHQRYDQAKVLISKIRNNSGPAGEAFMEDEFTKIKELASRD